MYVFGIFLISIFLHWDWIRRDTEYLSVFSPNAGKYWPENLQILTLFTQCSLSIFNHCSQFRKVTRRQKDNSFWCFTLHWLKGTLMQIWKSPYMFVFIWKQYLENFAFLIPRIPELFTRGACKFFKN